MKNFKEYAQDKTASAPLPRSTAHQAEHQTVEAEHWEALLTLLTQPPAAASPAIVSRARKAVGGAATIAPEPLLKSVPHPESIKIARSTAENFPLPSIVPSAKAAKQSAEPVAEPAAKPIAEKVAPLKMQEDVAPDLKALPAARLSNRAESRRYTAQPAPLPERLTESWAERLAHRVFSSFGQNSGSRASNIKPSNHAEVAYNTQGKVDYVTYTINAPIRKNRREPLT
jgi:hypothetical protein